MRMAVTAEVVERFVAAGGPRAETTLHDALRRAETHLNSMLAAVGAGDEGDIVIDAPSLDVERVATVKAPQLATVLLSVALGIVTPSAPTVEERAAPTRRRRPSEADSAGAALANLPKSEVMVIYVPHGSMVRGSTGAAMDEMLSVEDRIADAIENHKGAAIVDKSGWEWRVRIP